MYECTEQRMQCWTVQAAAQDITPPPLELCIPKVPTVASGKGMPGAPLPLQRSTDVPGRRSTDLPAPLMVPQ